MIDRSPIRPFKKEGLSGTGIIQDDDSSRDVSQFAVQKRTGTEK